MKRANLLIRKADRDGLADLGFCGDGRILVEMIGLSGLLVCSSPSTKRTPVTIFGISSKPWSRRQCFWAPRPSLKTMGDLFRYWQVPIHLRLLRFLTATRCLKSSDRPCAFGADLLNDRIGSEIGQEQRGDEHEAEDGFDAI